MIFNVSSSDLLAATATPFRPFLAPQTSQPLSHHPTDRPDQSPCSSSTLAPVGAGIRAWHLVVCTVVAVQEGLVRCVDGLAMSGPR